LKQILYLRQLPGGGEGPAWYLTTQGEPSPKRAATRYFRSGSAQLVTGQKGGDQESTMFSTAEMARAAALAAAFEVRN
jgi:hypothetical protein